MVLDLMLHLLMSSAAAATAPPSTVLEPVFSCTSDKASVKASASALTDAKGARLIAAVAGADGEYHLAVPLDIFGVRTDRVSVQSEERDGGRVATTYGSLLTNALVQDVALIAGVDRNASGDFRKSLSPRRTIFLVQYGKDVLVQCQID